VIEVFDHCISNIDGYSTVQEAVLPSHMVEGHTHCIEDPFTKIEYEELTYTRVLLFFEVL
jgi:hypothetical protein